MELASKHQDNPNIIIYRNHLLRASETFIREQAGALRNFTPFYVGTRAVSGLTLPPNCFQVVNGNTYGKLWEYYSQKFGFTPAFLRKLKRTNASLIHAHFAQDAATAIPLAKAFRIPLVATFHGFDVTVHDRYAEKTWIQQQYFVRRERLKHSAKLFVAVSDFIKQKAIAQGFLKSELWFIILALMPSDFKHCPISNVILSYCLWVVWLKRKGVNTFCKPCKGFKHRCRRWRWL
jgi:Glycosyltransferase Family 4